MNVPINYTHTQKKVSLPKNLVNSVQGWNSHRTIIFSVYHPESKYKIQVII